MHALTSCFKYAKPSLFFSFSLALQLPLPAQQYLIKCLFLSSFSIHFFLLLLLLINDTYTAYT